jgi:hypothetical protein
MTAKGHFRPIQSVLPAGSCPLRPRDRDRGAFRLRPSHTTVRTGPYTAVREVTLTRFDQGRKTERFEVGIGESDGEGFAPGEMPGSTAASGHVAQLPRDSQRNECCSPTPWCFPLAPEGSPQSQPDPTSESDQQPRRFTKAEIAAPTPHIRDQFFIVVSMLTPLALRVISRIRRSVDRSSDAHPQ